MILTEEEAKTKRCQESFPAAEGLSAGGFTEAVPLPPNAFSAGYVSSYAKQTAPLMCIGSACMAWRWVRETLYHPDPLDPTHFTKLEWVGDYSTTHGYCGKAGRP